MNRMFLALVCFFLPLTAQADEVTDLKVALAIAEARAQRLESLLQVVPEPQPVIAPVITPIANPTITPPTRLKSHITPQYTTIHETRYRSVRVKHCDGRRCWYTEELKPYTVAVKVPVIERSDPTPPQSADQYASPTDVVDRALAALNPSRSETFLDIGSGDGRVVIAAARKYGCRAIGIEQDPERIALAKANAEQAGVSHLVTFIQGDFRKIEWPRADVGYVYLFPDDLSPIRSKLTRLNRFVSFSHQVPELPMRDHGDFYSWKAQPVAVQQVGIWYGGRFYTQPPCNRANCSMCNYIRAELAKQKGY